MKKSILGIFVFSLIVMGIGFSSAAQTGTANMTVKANVLSTSVSLSVPNSIIIGDIAPGYVSDLESFSIINTGTTDIQVMPEIASSTNDTLFKNIGFKRVQTDDLTKIGVFNINIEKPDKVGGERDQNLYMQLDLSGYSGDATGENNATIVFTAVPQ